MASNVTVQIDDLRKQNVKTTPMMSLKAILDTVCQKHKLNPDDYGLKHKGNLLDLSLSMRFANLASGARLDLVKVSGSLKSSSSAGGTVSVALQSDDSGRMTGQFASDTSLWSILLSFEERSKGLLNLTRRTEKPSNNASKQVFSLKNFAKLMDNAAHGRKNDGNVYFQPVVVIMAKEYSTIPVLQETTLKSIGFSSGSVSVRILFKETDVPIDDIMHLIEQQNAPATEVVKRETKDVPKVPPKEKKQEVVKDIKPEEMPVSPPPVAQSNASEAIAFDRKVKIFRQAEGTASKIELPDSFYELTPLELKFALRATEQKRKLETEKPLMTKAMRDKEEAERAKKYPKTLIRIRFSDLIHLQGEFLTQEHVSAIYDFTRSHLMDETLQFVLYVTPPLTKFNTTELLEQDLYRAGLAPASVIHFQPLNNELSKAGGAALLKKEILDKLEVLNHPSLNEWIPPAGNTSSSAETSEMHTNEEEASTSDNVPYQSRSSSLAGNANDASGSNNNSNQERKMPKWFKMPYKK